MMQQFKKKKNPADNSRGKKTPSEIKTDIKLKRKENHNMSQHEKYKTFSGPGLGSEPRSPGIIDS